MALSVIVSFFIVLLSMLFYLYRDGGALIMEGDVLQQSIPFGAAINHMLRNREIGWSWNIGLGTQSIGGWASYGLGSPFVWLADLFPARLMPYIYAPF